MRTRKGIEHQSLYEADGWEELIARRTHLVLETLLDIRDLLQPVDIEAKQPCIHEDNVVCTKCGEQAKQPEEIDVQMLLDEYAALYRQSQIVTDNSLPSTRMQNIVETIKSAIQSQ